MCEFIPVFSIMFYCLDVNNGCLHLLYFHTYFEAKNVILCSDITFLAQDYFVIQLVCDFIWIIFSVFVFIGTIEFSKGILQTLMNLYIIFYYHEHFNNVDFHSPDPRICFHLPELCSISSVVLYNCPFTQLPSLWVSSFHRTNDYWRYYESYNCHFLAEYIGDH